ncbi:Tim44 domain-containing protein [Robbsia andropogonis]|uniref:Tim44 domain-containing protein n=1 Tax=Robbsia andropogonis TaxID=28092 RepID=UPI0004AFB3E2|nr:TIM44-like domain-containing protein [Robbsia andropogonis]
MSTAGMEAVRSFGRSIVRSLRRVKVPAVKVGALSIVAVVAFAAMTEHADARRMGSSRSMGRQSPMVSQQAPTRPATPAPSAAAKPNTPAPAAAQPARNRWMGPLAGLAAGLGIAALLSHFGLGGALAGAMANMIVIALIAFVAIWLIRKFMSRRQPAAPTPAYAAAGTGPSSGLGGSDRDAGSRFDGVTSAQTAQSGSSGRWSDAPGSAAGLAGGAFGASTHAAQAQPAADVPHQQWGVPGDFDQTTFLHNAKVYFVRMQAAWDASDLDDLRDFTTPEMFAELRLDLQSRGESKNRTDVVRVDAELLGMEDTATDYLASVRFTGLIRENEGATAEEFAEVWNLIKRKKEQSGWLLAGIQQLH